MGPKDTLQDEKKLRWEEDKKIIQEQFLRPLREKNEILCRRVYAEEQRERADGEYQRDYTRILYSSSFRRLQNKMQLLAVESDQFIRNRLTHSLEVAQLARSIATKIGYNEEEKYVVEACSLAHDIGNPPFGHAGERYLNILAKKFGGFEGNAQTFRILTTVEQKRVDFQGLNLTYRTLLGVLKYYNRFNYDLDAKSSLFSKQKFVYDADYDLVEKIVKESSIDLRTLDVQIVALADEIAYAAHDLEDGLRLGLFSVDEILHGFYNLKGEQAKENIGHLENIFHESKMKAGYTRADVDSSEYSKLYRKEVTSRIINLLINDIGIVDLAEKTRTKRGTLHDKELGFVNHEDIASGLKEVVFNCVTKKDNVYEYENNGKRMLGELFRFYIKNTNYLPPEYRAEKIIKQYKQSYENVNESDLQKRLIIDYLSGMMDPYVKTAYNRLIRR